MSSRAPNNPDYWRSLNPDLGISETGARLEPEQRPPTLAADWREQLVDEGYLQLEDRLEVSDIERLRQAIENIVADSWPAVLCAVYDEFWRLFARLRRLLPPILGEDYRILPAFWAWRLDPAKEEAGWDPHRDRNIDTLLRDGMPKSLTTWVPLTDATPLNGCMYVLPASRDPDYRNFLGSDQAPALQHIRALPAAPGTVLLWNQRILHWGGVSSRRATVPRISLAMEFQRGDESPYREPLLDPNELPPFELRVKLITHLLAKYRPFTE